MKIRQGFVSNSSSSSFLIFGNKLDISKVTYNMIKKNNIYAIGDGYLPEGYDVFQIKTIEELAFLKSLNNIEVETTFVIVDSFVIKNDRECDEDGFDEIDVTKLPKTGKVKYFQGEKDYQSSIGIENLKERYDRYGKVTSGMQKYLRSKKLNNLNKIEKSE